MTIEPDPNWYGTYARRSAIADYLELLALVGRSWSLEDLADRIRDNHWSSLLSARIGISTEPDEDNGQLAVEVDASIERAGDVVGVVNERIAAGPLSYPFAIDGSSRITYVGTDPESTPYIRLLALTVGHATRIHVTLPPHQVFEVIVAHAFEQFGLPTTGIGARSREGGTFRDVLVDCCDAVGLAAYPEQAAARVFANDEGADVLSNLWPHDRRAGGLQLLGQVTCAKSNDWDHKIGEPSPLQWRNWLGGMRSPVVYLAVPHHVEDVTRSYLMQRNDRDVVDRLRLSVMLDEVLLPGEAEIVETVLSSPLD